MKRAKKFQSGQALTEFALIIIILLMMLFVIIESARIFQANLALQNAAREGARYAITGNYDPSCFAATPACDDPRVHSIKQIVRERAAGLSIDEGVAFDEPKYFLVEVFGGRVQDNGTVEMIPNYAGDAGQQVMVRTSYRIPIISPFINSVADSLRLDSTVLMLNGNFDQIATIKSQETPPDLPINGIPTIGPSPTNTPLPPCNLDILQDYLLPSDNQIDVIADKNTPVTLIDTGIDVDGDGVGDGPIVGIGTSYTNDTPSGYCGGSVSFNIDLSTMMGHIFQAVGTANSSSQSDYVKVLGTPPEPTPRPPLTPTSSNPTSTPVPSNTPTISPTPTETPSNPYLSLSHTCADPGATVTVYGYNWPTNANGNMTNRTVFITWGSSNGTVLASFLNENEPNPANWSKQVTIPASATAGTNQIWATRKNSTAFAQILIPCPTATPTNTPENTATPTNTPPPTLTPFPTYTPTPTLIPDDLIISQVQLVSTPPIVEYKPVEFTVAVTNTGQVTISNQFFVSLYFNPTPPPISGDTHISNTHRVRTQAVSNLAGNGGRTITFTVPAGFTGAYTHTVYSVVDSDPAPHGQVTGEEETNNISSPLMVDVGQGLTPTPTATPPSSDSGSIDGISFVQLERDAVPQFNIEMKAYYDDGLGNSALMATTFTDIYGLFSFPNLPAAEGASTYTLTGCIVIDGTEYFGAFPGITVPDGETAFIVMILREGMCS